ncbi:hypothetical protein BaRGS_00010395, partial [Batillaria attramentaria]
MVGRRRNVANCVSVKHAGFTLQVIAEIWVLGAGSEDSLQQCEALYSCEDE